MPVQGKVTDRGVRGFLLVPMRLSGRQLTMTFKERLATAWSQSDSMLCIGLDPDAARVPVCVQQQERPLAAFCGAVIEATADLACAYKPQLAHFLGQGALPQLKDAVAAIRKLAPHAVVILDAKFGDIGSTAEWYTRFAFEEIKADAVTLNPYLGSDSLRPFLKDDRKGGFVLCHTSNKSATELQTVRDVDENPLYLATARLAQSAWNAQENTGLVVGATYPDALQQVRKAAPSLPILVPGIGAQGGDLNAVMASGRTPDGRGLVINASRSILYASSGPDYAEASRAAAKTLVASMRAG